MTATSRFAFTLLLTLLPIAALAQPAAAPPSLDQLQKDRLAAAKDLLAAVTEQFNAGTTTCAEFLAAAQKVYESQLEPATTDAQRLQAAQDYVKVCDEQLDTIHQRSLGGLSTAADLAAAKYQLTTAQVAAAKFQAKH